jgi:hypothetical protein
MIGIDALKRERLGVHARPRRPEDLCADHQLGYGNGHALLEHLRHAALLEVRIELGPVLERPLEWGPGPRSG